MINLSLSLLKHSDIREEIKKYLEEKYNITYTDGSNFNYIVEFLSILNMMMSYQLTNVAKNLTLSAVNDRSIAVSLAQRIGYSPKKRIPATMTGKFKISKAGLTNIYMTNIVLSGSDTGFFYKVDDIEIIAGEMDNYLVGKNVWEIPFTAKQLEARQITTKLDNTMTVYIDSQKIAEEDLTITVGGDQYDNYQTFDFIPTSLDKVFFEREDTDNEGRVFVGFGNGIIGYTPETDEDTEITYWITEGADGNGETTLSITSFNDPTLALGDISITNLSFSYGGKERESLEEIKINAPRFYNTKNRLVTKSDYESLLKKIVDVDIRFFSIIDAYSQNNLENFYKLGNIYLSFVPQDIYSIEDTSASVLTKGQTLAFDDIATITYPIGQTGDNYLSAYEKNFIISTNRVIVSPTYLYIDIKPKIELSNKNYSIGLINQDLLPMFKEYSYEIEGLGKDFREDIITQMLMDDNRIKGVDLDIDFSLAINKTNITVGTKSLPVPKNVICSNVDGSNLDNLYMGYSYYFNNMPDNRKSIYGKLKTDEIADFERYLVSDNYTMSANTSLAVELFINTPPMENTDDPNWNPVDEFDNTDYYKFQSWRLQLNDGSIGEVAIRTKADYEADDTIFPMKQNSIDSVTGEITWEIPIKFTQGTGATVGTTWQPISDKAIYFIYFKKNLDMYLLGTIEYEIEDEDDDINRYNFKINYLNITEATQPETYNLMLKHGFVVKNGKTFVTNFDYTYNLSASSNEETNAKISVYLIVDTASQQTIEYLKINAYKPICTVYIDSDNVIAQKDISDGFSSGNTSDGTYQYLNIKADTTLILKLKRDIATGDIFLNESAKYDYPSGWDNYKNQVFSLVDGVLYCHEVVDDTIIGYYDRDHSKLIFNDMVYYNNGYIRLETFLENSDGTEIIDDDNVYRIYLRNNFQITNSNIKYLHDFDDIGGVCCLYNFHSATTI